jgi:hypothetical protein
VLFVPAVAVGAVGTPVNAGLAKGAYGATKVAKPAPLTVKLADKVVNAPDEAVTEPTADGVVRKFDKVSAVGTMVTIALPSRLSKAPVEDSRNVRATVGPVEEYTPVPISHAVPSSIKYSNVFPLTMPAAAND